MGVHAKALTFISIAKSSRVSVQNVSGSCQAWSGTPKAVCLCSRCEVGHGILVWRDLHVWCGAGAGYGGGGSGATKPVWKVVFRRLPGREGFIGAFDKWILWQSLSLRTHSSFSSFYFLSSRPAPGILAFDDCIFSIDVWLFPGMPASFLNRWKVPIIPAGLRASMPVFDEDLALSFLEW